MGWVIASQNRLRGESMRVLASQRQHEGRVLSSQRRRALGGVLASQRRRGGLGACQLATARGEGACQPATARAAEGACQPATAWRVGCRRGVLGGCLPVAARGAACLPASDGVAGGRLAAGDGGGKAWGAGRPATCFGEKPEGPAAVHPASSATALSDARRQVSCALACWCLARKAGLLDPLDPHT